MTVIVEHRRSKLGKAGDRIRQGRADRASNAGARPPKIDLHYDQRADGCIYVMSQVVELGVICHQPQGGRPGFNYLCFLPGQSSKPKYAADLDKAKDAMRSAIETFVEAAGWSARPRHPHRNAGNVVGWRARE